MWPHRGRSFVVAFLANAAIIRERDRIWQRGRDVLEKREHSGERENGVRNMAHV